MLNVYIRRLPWETYLRTEAMIYVFRNSLPDAEEIDALMAVWNECRRIIRAHQQNANDNLILARRMGTGR